MSKKLILVLGVLAVGLGVLFIWCCPLSNKKTGVILPPPTGIAESIKPPFSPHKDSVAMVSFRPSGLQGVLDWGKGP